ncbi:hypothetical protein MMC29_007728 [Sticta canariensis]|nr:hypothetical protein [Sticta canariensis]
MNILSATASHMKKSVSTAAPEPTSIPTNSDDAGRDDMAIVNPAKSPPQSFSHGSPVLYGAIRKRRSPLSKRKHKWADRVELLQKFRKRAADPGGAPIGLVAWALGAEPTAEGASAPEAVRGGPSAVARHHVVMMLMKQIYHDIHVCSAPRPVDATSDLANFLGGEPGAAMHNENLALKTKKMLKVIEYAIAGSESSRDCFPDMANTAVSQLRDQPDTIGRSSDVAANEVNLSKRYASFAAEHGWMMLSILANSAAFHEAARTLDGRLWFAFNLSIFLNKNSLEYFAKIRGLDWTLALMREPEHAADVADLREAYPGLEPDHPHSYIVPRDSNPVRRPQYNGKIQKNIIGNRYDALSYRPSARPKKRPRDPTIDKRRRCYICNRKSCRCDPSRCEGVLRPLVELAESGNNVGVGIRVLQPIPKNRLLAEYVGEIVPSDGSVDDTYLCRTRNASVDAQEHGNWTRFINHSCDAHAELSNVVIGNRHRCMVKSIKDVGMFEQLTLDYGDLYWATRASLCQCGSPNCRFATIQKRDETAISLGLKPVGS